MSAVMPDQPTNNVAEFFSPGPGERLRAARLSMGYDLAKIASELHLTMPVVEALEADQFDDIGVRVFVRGYLRNYARIVGMPVDSILRQFDEKWPDDVVHQTMVRQSPTLPADAGPSRGLAGAMSWLLLIGAVALFVMWWRGYLDGIVPEQIRSTGAEDAPFVAESTMASDDGFNLATGENPALADGSLRLPAPPGDLPTDNGDADSASPAVGPQSAPVAGTGSGDSLALPAAASGADIGLTSPASTQTALQSAPASVPVGPTPTVTGAPTSDGGAPVVDGTQQIVMSFSGACWVDVRDSERKFKLFGEMPKGSRKVLGGKPPYKLVIGNAKVVKIAVNGKPFDLTPYAKGNVARFTLNP